MTAVSGNRYSRRYPITNYDWQRMSHDLAVCKASDLDLSDYEVSDGTQRK
jgi:hypothetical protein